MPRTLWLSETSLNSNVSIINILQVQYNDHFSLFPFLPHNPSIPFHSIFYMFIYVVAFEFGSIPRVKSVLCSPSSSRHISKHTLSYVSHAVYTFKSATTSIACNVKCMNMNEINNLSEFMYSCWKH